MSREYEAMEVEKWVNLEDIADHLSVSTDTVRNWIKSGKIPYYRAGKRYKFRISEVDEWLKSGKMNDENEGYADREGLSWNQGNTGL